MTVTTSPKTRAHRYPFSRAARLFVIGFAVLPLLFAGAGDGLARAKKEPPRQSQHSVKKPAAKRHSAKKPSAASRAAAKDKSADKSKDDAKPARPPAPPLRSAILIDTETGEVLSETKPHAAAFPASLTKMMTLYLTFAALNDGRLTLDQTVPVSAHAAAQAPSKLWLKPGDSVAVRSLILGLVTRSANDAAVVLAEAIGGTEADFAARMTETARHLGMNDTTFRNASGLPDPQHRTTARDLARLSLALFQNFPREFGYFSVRQFEFRGQTITTHNHLLESYEGSDGNKTGFTRAAGFNLAASAERGGHRLIGVILGSPSRQVRDKEMAALLDRGFATLGGTHVASADTVEPAPGQSKPAGMIARVATYTSPVATAVAALPSKPAMRPAVSAAERDSADDEDRAIQLGAFRARAAAARLAKAAARLKPAKGKDVRIRKVAGGKKGSLYAVQVSDFTDKGARDACGALRKAKYRCFVVPESDEG
jgi:D-alanyl-D-alanine carboxypeptidase